MRLWHKDLIPVLPRQQLLAQWRECCCITRNIAVNGTPNHLLVNKIMDYPIEKDFYTYCTLIIMEMRRRGYNISQQAYHNWCKNMATAVNHRPFSLDNSDHDVFKGWHNTRYLTQCYFNLQEKYDCGGISEQEWNRVAQAYNLRFTKKV